MSDPILHPEEYANDVRSSYTDPAASSRPFDLVSLPSRGKLYTTGPLAGKEAIEVYYLTAKEEDILTAPNLLRSGKVMHHLLRSVLVDKKIDPEKMLLGDRNAVLVWLRTTGYGAEYPVQMKCKHCGKSFVNEFDLANLDIRFLQLEPDADGLFEHTLPVTKKTVKLRFLTAEQDTELDKMIESRAKKLNGSGNPMTLRLMQIIATVEGLDQDEKKRFIETLPVRDSRSIRQFISDNEPAIIMRQDAQCTECGTVTEEATIPITEHFFWPDA